ncbi:hypothetical protein PFMALIP_04664 [Plasmodium falciparum MaliPS096_E11]|uniref:Uncharacterized protein n=1 Tax=Plasmodium falciparum MaliPS096_E11 TaxID=1036727 RepID=A0A024WLB4_PLAFA|nr:hypothetical protein PFMALIP_04664 [Plasmodium falciparum MaliPS096_E11]
MKKTKHFSFNIILYIDIYFIYNTTVQYIIFVFINFYSIECFFIHKKLIFNFFFFFFFGIL